MPVIIKYPRDAEVLSELPPDKRAAFEKYMDDLNEEHARRQCPYGQGSLWTTTGAECWLSFFEDGFTPSEAMDEDMSNF